MKSFPSTLNRGGSNLIVTNVSSSIKDTLKASWQSAVNTGISSVTSGYGFDTDGIRYNAEIDKENLLDHTDISASNSLNVTHKQEKDIKYEDPLHMPIELMAVMNKYRAIVWEGQIEKAHTGFGKDPNTPKDELNYLVNTATVTPSLFNPYYGMFAQGPTLATPLMLNAKPAFDGTDDCSIAKLVELSSLPGTTESNQSELGQARYKYADFMYCKDLGKISNNHLITLRRFASPIGDNIFNMAAVEGSDYSQQGDIGRLVTWFGTEDNKLEDILNYSFHATWKKVDSNIDQQQSEAQTNTENSNKPLNKFLTMVSPSFLNAIRKGTNPGKDFGFVNIGAGDYANNSVMLGENYDAHRIYEPQDTVRDTHLYDGCLQFNHEFQLKFSYKLRAYDNINPKAAFLDLIANVLAVTYKRGEFWGGRNEVLGVQPWNEGYNLANSLIDKTEDTIRTELQNLISGKFGLTWDNLKQAMTTTAANAQEAVKELIENPKNFSKIIGSFSPSVPGAIAGLFGGVLKNFLGRPAVYKFNSILSGGPVGLWHVTIGNPRNPIAAFGNLIMDDCSIQHKGPLGIDGFPSELVVTVKLKHARSRDMMEIQRMYTAGKMTPIYQSLNGITDIAKIYNIGGVKSEQTTISKVTSGKGNLAYNYLGDAVQERIQTNRLQLT
jgi:hypothetical protein